MEERKYLSLCRYHSYPKRIAMPRQSKIKYDPALTLKQNAEKNGVSIDAIKYFVKTRGIDR